MIAAVRGIDNLVWFEFVIAPVLVLLVAYIGRRLFMAVGSWGRGVLTALEAMPSIASLVEVHKDGLAKLDAENVKRIDEIEAITRGLEAGSRRMDLQDGRFNALREAVTDIAKQAGADVTIPPVGGALAAHQ